ncbi:MAG: hypothetical protein RR588_12540 [Solibacillus sp.]
MFIVPKINWVRTDVFDLYPDYFRIKNNILELQKLVSRLYKPFNNIKMKDYGIDDTGFADFYNNIERNIDVLVDNGFRNQKIAKSVTWGDNKATWSYHDLNRIEGSISIIYHDMMTQIKNQYSINFILGGEDFEQTV